MFFEEQVTSEAVHDAAHSPFSHKIWLKGHVFYAANESYEEAGSLRMLICECSEQ